MKAAPKERQGGRRHPAEQFFIAILALMVIFATLGNFPIKQAHASEQSFFESVQLKDSYNQLIDASKSTDNPVKTGDLIHLEYAWKLTADETASVQIPKDFKIAKNIAGEVKTADGQQVGTYTVTESDDTANANQLTVKFTDAAKSQIGAEGKISFTAVFAENVNAGSQTADLQFDLGNNQTQKLTVPVKETETDGSASSAANKEVSSSDKSDASTSTTVTKQQENTGVASSQKEVSASAAKTQKQMLTKSLAATGSEIQDNILTNVKVTDSGGKEWDSSNRPGLDSPADIYLDWALKSSNGSDLDVHNGDYYTFQLLNQFAIYNEIDGNLETADGISVGTFTITPDQNNVGTVKMVFNDYAESHSNVAGTLEVHTQFNKETITGSIQQEIRFPVQSGDIIVKIPFSTDKVAAIDKQGTADKSINAKNINWTVNINKTENTLTNAVVKDPLPSGLTLNKDSVKIFKITQVNIDGSIAVDSDPISTDQYTVIGDDGGTSLEIDFKDKIDGAYQIQYSTAIKDSTKAGSFNNEATLSSDGNDDVSAKATVTTATGKHLEKSGKYDPKTQTINWTINYNGDEQSIKQADAVLHDLFNNTQELVPGSVKVYNATVADDGTFKQGSQVDGGAYTVTPKTDVSGSDGTEKNGFDLQFNQEIDSSYQITYTTKATGLVTENGTINNTVTADGNSSTSNSQGISQQGIIKQNTSADFNKKTTTWKITVNGNNYNLKNPVIKDTFDDKGLALQPDTLKIVATTAPDADGKTTATTLDSSDYNLSYDDGGFTITFNDGYTTTDSFEITYTTNFDYNKLTSDDHKFYNTSKLTWTNEDNKETSSTSTATLDPDDYTKSNGFKSGSYDVASKQITWKIGINYNGAVIQDPIITDPILGDQKYVDGSLEVHYMTLTGGRNGISVGGIVPAENYTVDYPSGDKNTLTIHFKNPIDSSYYITFKTSLEGQIVSDNYENTAAVTDGDKEVASLTGSVKPTNGGSFASKSGAQDGNYIDWTVNINPSQSTVNDAVLEDTPTNNQFLDAGSFHLYPAVVNSNGSLTPDTSKELKQGTDYQLTINTDNDTGQQNFKLTFTNAIDGAYVLTYKTMINASNGDKVGNTALLSGNNIQPYTKEADDNVVVKLSTGGGTGSGETGGLTVTKTDADSKAPLSGATFTLYDKTGNTALRTLTTASDGTATFSNFKYGDYVLKEVKAPDGYVVNPEYKDGKTVTIGDPPSGKSTSQVTVSDQKYIGQVILSKSDVKSGEKLQGAVFQLQDKSGKAVPGYSDQKTDVSGQLDFNNLLPGDYQLVEVKAPEGYQLDATPYTFTIAQDQTKVVNISAADKLTPGDVTLTKVDANDQSAVLPGAEFKLENSQGDSVTKDDNDKDLPSVWTTDENGRFTVKNLTPGDYQFVETKAPKDYELDTTPIPFTIEKGQASAKEITASDKAIPGDVTLTKVDANDQSAVLQGAEFKLENSHGDSVLKDANGKDLPSVWTTDENGRFTVKDLAPGDYRFVETKAPKNYELDATPIPFAIEKGQASAKEITASDKLTPGDVTLTKVDANDKSAVLQGAEFKLENSHGDSVTKDANGKDLPSVWTTDENGRFTVKDLAPGDYQFVETKAPKNYELDATPIPFTIEKGQPSAKEITASDKLTPGDVTLTKVDANDKNAVLQGAEFKLENSHGDSVTKDANGKDLPSVWTTDENGRFTVKDLAPGDYQFVETKAPKNYELDATPIPFTIVKGQASAKEITASDKLTPGDVTLTKVDANDKNAVLQGAEFKLENSHGDSVTKDANGKDLPSVWTTDENGRFTVKDLAPGDYQFVETKAPKNYELDATPIPFTIVKGQASAKEITASDKLTPGDVTLTKVDANDKNAVLQGAEFKLENSHGSAVTKDANGKDLPLVWTTDENGRFTVKDLAPGDYQFVETKAPENYELDATPIPFAIEKGQASAKEITAADKAIPIVNNGTHDGDQNGSPTKNRLQNEKQSGSKHAAPKKSNQNNIANLPITGDGNNALAMIAGALLLLAGGWLAMSKRRKDN